MTHEDVIFLPCTVLGEPQCVLVMTELELVAVDLTTDGWPLYRAPYLSNIAASSPITCIQHAVGVSDDVWNNITAAGDADSGQWSTKVVVYYLYHMCYVVRC